jgi:hypothetical protein
VKSMPLSRSTQCCLLLKVRNHPVSNRRIHSSRGGVVVDASRLGRAPASDEARSEGTRGCFVASLLARNMPGSHMRGLVVILEAAECMRRDGRCFVESSLNLASSRDM